LPRTAVFMPRDDKLFREHHRRGSGRAPVHKGGAVM